MDKTKHDKDLKDLFSYNYLRLPRPLIKVFGIKPALMLSELYSQYNYWNENGKLNKDGYFFATAETIQKNVGLTAYEQRTAIKVLVDYGIIKTHNHGLPPIRYFRIENDGLAKLVSEVTSDKAKESKPDGANQPIGSPAQSTKSPYGGVAF